MQWHCVTLVVADGYSFDQENYQIWLLFGVKYVDNKIPFVQPSGEAIPCQKVFFGYHTSPKVQTHLGTYFKREEEKNTPTQKNNCDHMSEQLFLKDF